MVLEELGRLFQKPPAKPSKAAVAAKSADAQVASLRLRDSFYRKIISRYSQAISEGEEKTIPELKALVNPSDATVQSLHAKMLIEERQASGKEASLPFDAALEFFLIAKRCFSFCQSLAHINSSLDLSFWLSPADVVELSAADSMDRALLLCSLLRSFGASAKIRVAELESGITHPMVLLAHGGKIFALDASSPESSFDSFSGADAQLALAGFSHDGNKYVKGEYEFSDEEYNEL